MRLIINNTETNVIVGGKDNLLDIDIEKELYDYLKVKMKNAYFARQKGQKWDGFRRFYSKDTHKFATGFLPMVIPFLEELGVTLTITDQRTNIPTPCDSIETFWGEHEAREYQLKMVSKLLDNTIKYKGGEIYFPRGIFDAATNAGKTAMAIGVMNNFKKAKCLFLIHNKEIFEQLKDDFSPYFKVGEIRSGKYDISNEITIGMVKTVYNRIKEGGITVRMDLSSFNIVIVDEGHYSGGAEYSKVLKHIEAGCRLVISGTPLDNADNIANMLVIGHTGKVLGKVTTKELIDLGVSRKPLVHYHLIKTHLDRPCITYEEEFYTCIVHSQERNNKIAELVWEREGKQIIIAFDERQHGKNIFDAINKSRGKSDIKVDWVHGLDPFRKQKLQDFKEGKINVLIASTILKEGLNIKNIDVMIFAIGGRSKITIKQYFIGRSVRLKGVEKTVELIDFYDVGLHISKHSRYRIKLLKSEGLDVTEHYETKRGVAIIKN